MLMQTIGDNVLKNAVSTESISIKARKIYYDQPCLDVGFEPEICI